MLFLGNLELPSCFYSDLIGVYFLITSSSMYLKINFDDNIRDRLGDVYFVIHESSSMLVVARRSHLFGLTVSIVKLHAAWMGIAYA